MAEEAQYSSDGGSHKRKYEEPTAPLSTRRPTGFSAPIPSASPDSGLPPPPSYNNVPPPVAADMQQVLDAKQKAQEVVSRLLFSASVGGAAGAGTGGGVGGFAGGFDVKRPRVENGGGFDSSGRDGKPAPSSVPSSIPVSYSNYGQGTSKKIEIPNDRVGVIIGKGGESIKSLQNQSGAKIQVTRDMDTDPHATTRAVEIVGTAEQISRAEQLIKEVLAEADAGGSSMGSRRAPSYTGGGQFEMKVPNNKVGLVIGKGGETIKNMQNRTGARIQVVPLHLPPGDTSNERSIFIDGTEEQIEAAKQLVGEVISSENHMRSSGMSGGYHQQGYQARPPSNWGAPPMQQSGYGYVQPGAYPGAPHYNMNQSHYGNYPPQPATGYAGWDQSAAPPSQPGGYYDYSQQQQPASQQQQQQGSTDPAGYNYNQQPSAASYGQQGHGYSQDGYGGYSHQSGYGQPPYDQQQQGYNASSGYGTATNQTQEGASAHSSYGGAQADSSQAPPVQPPAMGHQSGYSSAPPSYGMPPTSQPGYGSGYGAPPAAQKPQSQSPSSAAAGGYGQGSYPPYGQAPYGAPPPGAPQGGYGQQPPAYGGYGSSGAYAQPASYSADGAAAGRGGYEATPPASQATPPASTGPKASPQT